LGTGDTLVFEPHGGQAELELRTGPKGETRAGGVIDRRGDDG
jgi:hypothetical protein